MQYLTLGKVTPTVLQITNRVREILEKPTDRIVLTGGFAKPKEKRLQYVGWAFGRHLLDLQTYMLFVEFMAVCAENGARDPDLTAIRALGVGGYPLTPTQAAMLGVEKPEPVTWGTLEEAQEITARMAALLSREPTWNQP